MNKQRYLAELQRLLVFMTEEDRIATVGRYADMFDEAGEDGAESLVAQIGSPTKAAISLSRGYEPGSLSEGIPMDAAPRRAKAPSPESAWEGMDYDLSDYLPAEETYEGDSNQGEEEFFSRDPEEVFPTYEPTPTWEASDPEPWREPAGRVAHERSIPLGLGIPLFILIAAAVALPLFLLTVAVVALCLVPGLTGLFGAYLAAVGSLWCVSYIADALIISGMAFLLLALGLVLLWTGIWADGKLLDIYAKGFQWLCGELLGKRVTKDE